MSFAGHIAFCNSFDPARAVPLLRGEVRLGFVRRDNAEALRRFADVFEVADAAVRLVAPGDMASLSAAVDRVVDALVLERQIPK